MVIALTTVGPEGRGYFIYHVSRWGCGGEGRWEEKRLYSINCSVKIYGILPPHNLPSDCWTHTCFDKTSASSSVLLCPIFCQITSHPQNSAETPGKKTGKERKNKTPTCTFFVRAFRKSQACIPGSLTVHFSHSVVSSSLWLHGLQHARRPCPSPTPGVCSNSCSLSQWCHPTISSSVIPFSSSPQSFPSSGSFLRSQFFALGYQSIGAISILQHQSFQWIFRIDFL